MNSRLHFRMLTVFFAALVLSACETLPKNAFRLSETGLQTREIQTREYSSVDDAAILAASIAVLQDMGYTIEEVEKMLGVLSASKRADATNKMEAFGSLALDSMKCVFTLMLACDGKNYGEIDDVQDIRLTLITRPQREIDGEVSVRLTIQRVIWDKRGRLTAQQTITDSRVYEDFFAKLSKAVFLEQEGV